MKKPKTKQGGITLIALVISIIVMLILAGVSLNLTLGENGVIKQAQNAKIAQEDAVWNENAQSIIVDAFANKDNIEMLNDTQKADAGNNEAKIEQARRANMKAYLLSRFIQSGSKDVIVGDYEGGFLIVDGNRVFIVDRELKEAINAKAQKMLVETNEDWTYTAKADGTCVISGYNKTIGTSITIPAVLVDKSGENPKAYVVTEIGNSVFNYQPNLKHIDFSGVNNTLTKIGELAFANCEELEITIPNDLPSSIVSIGDYAFQNCKKLIGDIDQIQNSGILLGNAVFMNCPNLTGSFQSVFNQYFYLSNGTEPSSTIITEGQFSGFSGLSGALVIPSYITEIQKNAFSGCQGISSLSFAVDGTGSSALTTIGEKAFENCSGISGILTLPNSITSLGNSTFKDCKAITGLILPSDLATIGTNCFQNCTALTGELKIPYSLTLVSDYAFSNIGITKLTFETKTVSGALKGCTNIGKYAFDNDASITTIDFPNTLTKIAVYGFRDNSSLGSISFPNSLTSIGNNGFLNCYNLSVLNWGTGIQEIGEWCFPSSKVTTLPSNSSLTTIGAGAFQSCKFPSIDIISWINSNNITWIQSEAFKLCTNLYGNYNDLKDGVTIGADAFGGTSVTRESQVPKTGTSIAKGAYNGTTTFKDGNSIVTEITIPNTVTSIGENAFAGCKTITKITIPSSVTDIGAYAFSGCSSLSEVYFDGFKSTSGLTEIKKQTFRQCTNLGTINIPPSVKTIWGGAFQHAGNAKLTLKIPGNVEVFVGAISSNYGTFELSEGIKEVHFKGLTKCKKISLPNSVTTLREGCFGGCKALEEISLGTGVTSLPASCMKNTTSLTKVTFKGTVTSIGNECFSGCTGLTTLSGLTWTSLTNIGSQAFYNTPNLKSTVQIKNNCTIGQNAFLNTGLKWSRTN